MTNIVLNADQLRGEDEFVAFLLNPDEREMKIIGPGGVGKSFLVRYLVTEALKVYQQNCRLIGLEPEFEEYALTAMTHKAAQSLQDATGLDVGTIHSFLNLIIKPNFKTGKQDLARSVDWHIIENMIIIIDETFMMDSKLYAQLQQTTMKCKIIYVGDDAQLDPIEEAVSPICNLNCRTVNLTIPVRNADRPDLQALCSQMRQNVYDVVAAQALNQPYDWPMMRLVPGVIDHYDDAQMEAELMGPLRTPSNNHKILAFSNSKVNDFNNCLRLARNQGHLFDPGEVLISNDLYQRGRFSIRNEQMVELVHADTDVTHLKVGDLDIPTQYVRIAADNAQLIPTIIDRDFHRDAIKYVTKKAKEKQEDWSRYFMLKNDFADFRPRDASTVHKSQGSTYDVVYIDLSNIGACNFPTMVARMLYVAISRARFRVVFYGSLPSKYGGLIR